MSAVRPALAGLLAALAAGVACNPVHDDLVAALGPEVDGVRQGPLHRPGQPCLLCHDGALGDPQRFTVAGTVYRRPSSAEPAVNVTVSVVDATGRAWTKATNAAGNFYATASEFEPTFPLQVTLLLGNSAKVPMQTLVEGNGTVEPNGACASCHTMTVGPRSPGPVVVELDDGGIPP